MRPYLRTRCSKRIVDQAYFGANFCHVVEEAIYVADMVTAFAVTASVRKEAYGSKKQAVASMVLMTLRLALPTQLIEIKFIAIVR